MSRSSVAVLTLSLFVILCASLAHANSVELLNFAGLKDGQPVGNFYNGGSGIGDTPNWGITFSSNVVGLLPSTVGGSGGFGADPTASAYLYINNNSLGIMNVAGGFGSGLNFFYASLANETITVWSGANGSGTILATMTLSSSCAGTPSNCIWFDAGMHFAGTAQSVTFSAPGGVQAIGIADITLGQSTTAVPEPSSLYLLATGLLSICVGQLRRFIRT
jgi:hypothetical protein